MQKKHPSPRPVSPIAMAWDEGHDIQSPNDVHCNLGIGSSTRGTSESPWLSPKK